MGDLPWVEMAFAFSAVCFGINSTLERRRHAKTKRALADAKQDHYWTRHEMECMHNITLGILRCALCPACRETIEPYETEYLDGRGF